MEVYPPLISAKMQMDEQISHRPNAYRYTVWHSFLRIAFFIAGLLSLSASLFFVATGAARLVLAKSASGASEEIMHGTGKYVETFFAEWWVYFVYSILLFWLCITFFILARFCRKIIKRNLYIAKIESIYESMRAHI